MVKSNYICEVSVATASYPESRHYCQLALGGTP